MNWLGTPDSTIVSSCAYDDAAERIYVRLYSGTIWRYEECSRELWHRFIAQGTSKGEFLANVLEGKKHCVVPPGRA